jgi:hypothetical protein
MSDEQLRLAYARARDDRIEASRVGCPTLEALLALVQREGPESRRIETLDHASGCAACRRELEVLRSVDRAGRALAADQGGQAVGDRATVSGAGGRGRWRTGWRRAAPMALAAALLLAVGLGVRQRFGEGDLPDVPRAATGGVALVAPAEGGAVAPAPLTFVWRSVPQARQYVLEVMTDSGALLLAQPTTDTSVTARLPARTDGGTYRWSVRAQLADGTERRSAAWRLRTRAP